jgi:cysteine desulfurase
VIYLDHHASTPVDPRVVQAMLPFFTEHCGNPASLHHAAGAFANEAVETSRRQVARLIGARSPREIIFTSGATEAINLALKGVALAMASRGRHLITSAIEHKATLDACARLEALGFEVTRLGVDRHGRVRPQDVAAAIRPETLMVSLLHGHNEVGTLQPIAEIGEICRDRGVLFHLDAAQTCGKVPLDVEAARVDLCSISGHKFHGPKGVGALYVRRHSRIVLEPILDGGGQEQGMRSGTLNVPGIVGLGVACELAEQVMEHEGERLARLRNRLFELLAEAVKGLILNGHPSDRLPGNLNVSFPGMESDDLLMRLPDLALSVGSACSSGSLEPSHSFRAMGIPDPIARSAIRFGLGRATTLDEVERAADMVIRALRT